MSNQLTRKLHCMIKVLFHKSSFEGEIVSELIKKELLDLKPIMIARFGSVEIKAVLYPYLPPFIRSIFRKKIFDSMCQNAGFLPANDLSIRRFSKLMIEDMKLLDILGSWRIEERLLEKYYSKAKRVKLSELEPYLQDSPWSIVLKNKKVLVVHPFSSSIENQYYSKRENLFTNPNVLPEFKTLETIKAVQTIAGQQSEFIDWFDALDHMKSEINKKDFDVAIIGCGAYGFPLAAHVKRMGKKAIHLGGATQILFGVKGKRWVENRNFDEIINEYFVFPNEAERVTNAQSVEGGCYW